LEVKSHSGNYIVEKGHSLLYKASTHQFTGKNSIDTNSIAFATGVFSFTNTPLKELTAILAKGYKVGIQLEDPAIGDCRMTVQFDNLPIKSVLEIIAATLNIQYSIQQQGKMIYLNGRGCD
jgi:ferric-dicitrate binding protein FerR (iron transport regulator)